MKKREAKKQFKKASGKRANYPIKTAISQNIDYGEEIIFAKKMIGNAVVATESTLYVIKWVISNPKTYIIPFNTITQLSNKIGELKIMCGSNDFKINSASDKKIKQISKFIHSKIH